MKISVIGVLPGIEGPRRVNILVNESNYDGPVPAVGDEIEVRGGGSAKGYNELLRVVRKITRIQIVGGVRTEGHIVLECPLED